MIDTHKRREAHAQEASQLHPRREGSHSQRHLIDRVPISDLCDEYQLQPKVFYDWQKQFFATRIARRVMKRLGSSLFRGKGDAFETLELLRG